MLLYIEGPVVKPVEVPGLLQSSKHIENWQLKI
jgi:hypothetical protein